MNHLADIGGFQSPSVHALLVAGIFGAQMAVVYFSLRRYNETKDAPWFFLLLANVVFAGYFFLHAIVVPDLTIFSEALFDIFEHYGLFLGSIVLLVGALFRTDDQEPLYRLRGAIIWWWIAGNVAFIALFVLWPTLAGTLYAWVDYATGFYGAAFLVTSFLFLWRFYQSRERLNLYVAAGFLALVASAVTPFFYEEWDVLWLTNHIIIIFGGTMMFAGFLLNSKEKRENHIQTHIPFYRRVGFKLTVLILTITLVPLSLLGSYGFYISENVLRKQAIDDLKILVRSNYGHIDSFLYLLKSTATNFSSDGLIRRLMEEAALYPRKKEETLAALTKHLVKNKLPLDPYLIGINIIDAKGEVISSTNKTEIGKNESEDEYFVEGMKLAYGESLVTDYGKSSHFETTIPMITAVAPIVSLDDTRTMGIVVAYFNIDDVSAVLGSEDKKTLDIYLVNKNDLLISKSRFAGKEAILSQVVDTRPVQECKEGRNASGAWTSWRGTSVYGASVCFVDFPFRWTLIAEIEDSEVNRPAEVLRDFIIVAILLLIVVVIFIAFVASSSTIRSLKKLSHLAKKISRGDLDDPVDVRSTDEIGELSESLDTMRLGIKTRENDLMRTNDFLEKTSNELNEKVVDLDNSKKAVLNLLEDIEAEKGRVENLVQVRTKELNEEKARLLASINSLPLGFVVADTNDNIIVKNAAISTILELTEDITSVRRVVNSFKGVASGLDVLVHSCRECIDLKKVVELKELSHGTKYLRVFCTPILTRNETVSDAHEEVIGYVMLVEDITEAKIMERSRDEFFAVASHELRTPLTAIRGNSGMILSMYADKITDPDIKEMLQDINSSSVRLIDVVNDFLEVSRLEQGRVELKKEKFDIAEIVVKVVRDLKNIVEKKGLFLTYTPTTNPLPQVFADKNKTEQILLNLMGNATKFTKDGGITLEVVSDTRSLIVRVTDTGLGISEHNQALLFRKFQQAGEQMLARDVTQGTGLGLYISRLIVSAMGGTIGLEKSELGKGSTFFFTVPVADKI